VHQQGGGASERSGRASEAGARAERARKSFFQGSRRCPSRAEAGHRRVACVLAERACSRAREDARQGLKRVSRGLSGGDPPNPPCGRRGRMCATRVLGHTCPLAHPPGLGAS
jgi:hypothetical protein